MIKAYTQRTRLSAQSLVLLPLLGLSLCASAQQGSSGNTTIFSGAQMTFFGDHSFSSGGGGTQPGIIGTVRTAPYGILNFSTAANSYTGAGDAAHVDGYVRKLGTTSFIFPVGDNGQYGPFAASGDGTTGAYFNVDPSSAVTSSLGGGNYGVLPAGGPFSSGSMTGGVNAVSTAEYWDIDGSNATPLTLTWDAGSNVSTLTGGLLASLTIVGWNGSAWEPVGSTVDVTSVLGGASTLTAGSITTSAPVTPNTYTVYTLGAITNPLPVTLLSFNAVKDRGTALLSWKTADEQDLARFDAEHSSNGQDWATLGVVAAGKGNMSNYSFVHRTPANGLNLYRLKVTDLKGRHSYSAVRSLSFGSSNSTLYPNPATNFVTVADAGAVQSLSLADLAGREVYPMQPLQNGRLDLGHLAAGTYLVTILYKDGSTEQLRLIRK